MDRQEQKLQIQPNWLLFFLFLIFLSRSDTKKLGFQGMNLVDLDKKTKFLNRIKGYMDPQEQYIVHSAETILQIIRNVKVLMEPPQIASAGVRYSSFSLEDRKRNMLMDLSEFLEDEKKMLVHQAVDFDVKIRTLEKKLKEIHSLSQNGNHMANIHEYIEVFEPILADEVKEKVSEFKKLASIISVIGTLRNKEKISEMDIVEIIQPFIHKDQRDSLMRMVQIFKAVTSMSDDTTPTDNSKEQLSKESDVDYEVLENIETQTNKEKSFSNEEIST